MNKELIVKQLREMAKHPTVTLPRDCEALKAAADLIEQAQKQDHTYGYAKGLAEAIFKQHFASDEHYASGRIVWGVNDTVIGILTQIDNMVADMVRKPEQAQKQEPVGRFSKFTDGLWREVTDTSAGQPLYAAPPQRKPLTDEQIEDVCVKTYLKKEQPFATNLDAFKAIARAIEAAHGITGEQK